MALRGCATYGQVSSQVSARDCLLDQFLQCVVRGTRACTELERGAALLVALLGEELGVLVRAPNEGVDAEAELAESHEAAGAPVPLPVLLHGLQRARQLLHARHVLTVGQQVRARQRLHQLEQLRAAQVLHRRAAVPRLRQRRVQHARLCGAAGASSLCGVCGRIRGMDCIGCSCRGRGSGRRGAGSQFSCSSALRRFDRCACCLCCKGPHPCPPRLVSRGNGRSAEPAARTSCQRRRAARVVAAGAGGRSHDG